MRLAAMLLLGVAGAALVTSGIVKGRQRAEERRDARADGRRDADRDIEKGTPWLRREFHTHGRLPRDGIAVDRETGLPLSNTTQWCGTCRALWGHINDASAEGYNARMLEAFAAGRLDRFRLDGKLRDNATLRALFATGLTTVLKEDGATALVGQLKISIRCWEDLAVLELAPRDQAQGDEQPADVPRDFDALLAPTARFYLRYPHEYVDAPRRLSMQYAPAPFEVLLPDDDTTLILRDGEGYAWILDLPRQLILEVAGPIR